MATDALLAALQGNYGLGEAPADDVHTVRGLLRFCQQWPERRVHHEELQAPCLGMAARLRQAAKEMENDLAKTPDMAQEMRQPVTRTKEAYLAIAELLEELPELARDESVDDFLDNLDLFEEERQAVLDAQEQIQFQLSGQQRLCLRCGSAGEEEQCPSCLVLRLYPDPQAVKARHQQARLPGLYGKVFRSFQRVLSGERSLTALEAVMDPLQEHLEDLLSTRKSLAKRLAARQLTGRRLAEAHLAERTLAQAEAEIGAALRGLERMRASFESYRVSDLCRGWEDLFFAAQAIEQAMGRLRRQLGDEDEGCPEPASPDGPPDDLVSFSGE